MKIIQPSVELLSVTKEPTRLIEKAGRTCYKSEERITDNSANKFIEMISRNNHASVVEHASATFRIVTDRGISHEIVRHRIASYSQESSRYCNYSKDRFGREISVIKPDAVELGSMAFDVWGNAMSLAEHAYFSMLDNGAKPQIARAVLPTCLKTEIVMTANFREWMHFLNLRMSKAAHPDIRIIAFLVWEVLSSRCSTIFKTDKFRALAVDIVESSQML